ncbi:MAG: galactosyldiacylglycerol synthase [bacterium]|nr:galactosyldiacylglycerol synthase [bacterium]
MAARIDFTFFDAGGGHRSAATALQQVIESGQRPWDVRLVNLQDLMDSIDVVQRLTGLRIQDGYNLLLKKGWTVGMHWMLKALHVTIRRYHRDEVQLLERKWGAETPDMVVSLVPNFNRAQRQAFDRVAPGRPFVTVITDFADYPPHFWIENQVQQVICGSDRAVEQAREIGLPAERIHRTSGMILRPSFYSPVEVDRDAERARLGLEAGTPTGLVLFGGQGSKAMVEIAKRLAGAKTDVQLIMICGHNDKLAARLRAMIQPRMHVEGFTIEIPYFMHLSDFFIGKPGPGSISEAIAMNLPVVVERNAWTMPQERYNTEWVLEQGVGVVVPSFRKIGDAVREMLRGANLERYRVAAAAIENRAVFEIPDILESILAGRR